MGVFLLRNFLLHQPPRATTRPGSARTEQKTDPPPRARALRRMAGLIFLLVSGCWRALGRLHTKFFTSKVRQSIFEKGVIICESFTRKPRRNELFRAFLERHGKTRDGLLSPGRLHRSGRPSHRGWCGTMVRACSKTRQPVRRPNLRCALLRPVSQSGPRTGTCHPAFGQCALAPPIFSAAPLSMMPSRAGAPIQRA